jgi:Fic family protein
MNIEKPPTKINLSKIDKKDISLLSDPKIRTLINKCNDNYLYWDKVKYQNVDINISAQQFWNLLRFHRTLDSKTIKFGNYSFSIFISDKMNKLLHQLDMEMGGTVQNISQLSNTERKSCLLSSLQEEAIASSKMEGASTTRKIAKEILRKQDKPKDNNQRMIVNNFEAMQFLVDGKKDLLTPELILKVHKMITKGTLDNEDYEGSFRKNNDIKVNNSVTGEIVHTPPDYRELETLLKEICNFCNNENYFNFFIHPIVKSIILHFLISYIHPFVDGNGRTARSLVYWYLLKNNYWLIEYISISRIIHITKLKYEKSFLYTENDDNDLSYFINYNLDTLIKAKDDLKIYLDRKFKEKKDYSYFIGLNNINEREAQIINEFNKDPDRIMTILEVQNLFSISNQTARTNLDQLVKLEYLNKIKLNNRKFGYAAGVKLIES